MRRKFSERVEDSTFELNLAPMLDIIVSIVPMLLLSIAFVHVTVIDTPVPQAVEKAIAKQDNKDAVQILLHISKKEGFRYTVTEKGNSKDIVVPMKGTEFDLEGLHKESVALKKSYPDVFRLELNPDEAVPLDNIVAVMDTIRQTSAVEGKLTFNDVETGKPVETNLIFPDVVFGNVTGG
jgi:biopolymer transport protein ExbD